MRLFVVAMCASLLLEACASMSTSPDSTEKGVPVFKPYRGADGGYVAVYTHDQEHSVYSVGDNIYVAGLVRVQGYYVDRIFYPAGYGPGDDITHDAAILKLCDTFFPELKGGEWIGGDTGGFGLQ